MYVGGLGEYGYHLVENLLQSLHALVALHVEAHGFGKGCAVSGHVDFGYHGHATFSGIGFEFGALLLRVVVAGVARHVFGLRELRVGFYLKAPGQFLRQMPVEHVHLEAREQVDFLFQFVEGDERAAHVVHEAAHLEGGPVGQRERLDAGSTTLRSRAFGQLVERLRCAYHACGVEGLDGDGLWLYLDGIGLVGHVGHLVVECALNGADKFHRQRGCAGLVGQRAAVALQHLLQQHTLRGIGYAYGAAQCKRTAVSELHALGLGQEVERTGPCRRLHGEAQACHQYSGCRTWGVENVFHKIRFVDAHASRRKGGMHIQGS